MNQNLQPAPTGAVVGFYSPVLGRVVPTSPVNGEAVVVSARHFMAAEACELSRRQQAARKLSFQPRRG